MDYFVNAVFFITGTFLFVGYVFASTVLASQMLDKGKPIDQEMREFEEFQSRKL